MASVPKRAGTPFHLQDGRVRCGAAVALMMLADSDVGRDPRDLGESILLDRSKKATTRPVMDEKGLERILNEFKPEGKKPFGKTTAASRPEGTSVVVGHLCDVNPVSPAILTFGGQHWVAVEGVWLEGDPAGASYKLTMVLIHDPFARGDVDEKHFLGDRCPSLGVADRYVVYPAGWEDRFDGTLVGGKFLFFVVGRVGFPSTEKPGEISFPDPGSLGIERVDGIIKSTELPKLWGAFLDIYGGLPDGSSAKAFLAGAQPKATCFVEWKEKEKLFYLVTLVQDNQLRGTWVVNARNGVSDSIEVHFPGSALEVFYERLEREWADKTLVWRPCLESFSPHFPFLFSKGKDGRDRYERLDREIFERLTTDLKGV